MLLELLGKLGTPPGEGIVAVNFYRLCVGTAVVLAVILCFCGAYLVVFGNTASALILLLPGGLLLALCALAVFTVQRYKPHIDATTYYGFRKELRK